MASNSGAMHLQLKQIPGNIQSLAMTLSANADIKEDVNKLVMRGTKSVQAFERMMRQEYKQVYLQKELLLQAQDPESVNVTKMSNSVSDMTKALVAIRNDVISAQSEVHSDIEKCRARARQKQSSLVLYKNNVSMMEKEVGELESQISRLEDEVEELDDAVGKLEGRAIDIDREAVEKAGWGIGGIALAVAGALLAPFTLGLSLALTATGGILAGINLASAAECRDGARKARSSASDKRSEASRLRSRKTTMRNEIDENKRNIRTAENWIETLHTDEKTLQKMLDQMHEFVLVMDNVLNVFQEAETTLKDVHVNTNFFWIIINMFRRNPKKTQALSQRHLENLKAKWAEMETILSRHGINPRLTF